jgi:hypothetical protein
MTQWVRALCCLAAAVALVVLAPPAHADDAPTYTLERNRTIVLVGTGVVATVPCASVFALSRREDWLYVACGEEAVAVYSLADPAHPTFRGHYRYGEACFGFAPDGGCQTRAPTVRRNPGLIALGVVTTVAGGVSLIVAATLGLMQLVDVIGSVCLSSTCPGPAAARGYVALGALAGGLVAVGGGIALIVVGSKKVEATALITPTGVGLRLTF